jgi:hypothetical protein
VKTTALPWIFRYAWEMRDEKECEEKTPDIILREGKAVTVILDIAEYQEQLASKSDH